MREELFIDLHYDAEAVFGLGHQGARPDNYTMHCTASTTRGYFELGNHMNNYVYGPLLDKWPNEEYIFSETNNFLAVGASAEQPKEM